MEPAKYLNNSNLNLRTDVCVVLLDQPIPFQKKNFWSESAIQFFRKVIRDNKHLTIVGPKFIAKFGSKKNFRLLDRHKVVGLKKLELSRSHPNELRILGVKTKSWVRLRTEIVIVVGSRGIWPKKFDGWTSSGIQDLSAYHRWLFEFKTLPGRQVVFLGSTNEVFRNAIESIDQGVKNVFIVEEENEIKAWRSYSDYFLARGGRLLVNHQILKSESLNAKQTKHLFLKNEKGTLILEYDLLVIASTNEEVLNDPSEWKKGHFYYQLRTNGANTLRDEEISLEEDDWSELYYRVARHLETVDHKSIENSLKSIKQSRKQKLAYRSSRNNFILNYSGKVLDRETVTKMQASGSVPKSFVKATPIASLECFENVPCRICADVCPENAIDILKLTDLPKINSSKCTGCGLCVVACPSMAAVMIQETAGTGKAKYFLPSTIEKENKFEVSVNLQNRKGENLGQGKIINSMQFEGRRKSILQIEASDVFLWDARRFKIIPKIGAEDPGFLAMLKQSVQHNVEEEGRGWINVNGARRICKLNEPALITLGKMGLSRFEDALFCKDGGCGLCEIEVNGVKKLSCQTLVTEEMQIVVKESKSRELRSKVLNPLCVCRQIESEPIMKSYLESIPQKLICDQLGLGQGICHGRWCIQSSEFATSKDKIRPRFFGFEHSPWFDLSIADILRPED